MQCCKVYGQLPLEGSSKQICDKILETQRYTPLPVASRSDRRKTAPVYPNKSSVSIRQRLESAPVPQHTEPIPPPDNPTGPTDFTNDNSNEEDVYEEMVGFLREALNPSQMDTMLQHMKQSMYTTEEASHNPPLGRCQIYSTLGMHGITCESPFLL